MADINIPSLPLLTTPSATDYLHINSDGVDYKVSANSLLELDNRLTSLEEATFYRSTNQISTYTDFDDLPPGAWWINPSVVTGHNPAPQTYGFCNSYGSGTMSRFQTYTIYSAGSGENGRIQFVRSFANNVWGTWIPVGCLYGGYYSATGAIFTSPSDTAIKGNGYANCLINGNFCIINFAGKVTTAGTVSTGYDFGLRASVFNNLSGFPGILSAEARGNMYFTTTSGTFDRNKDTGYGGMISAQSNGQGWIFGRIYNDSGSWGAWAPNSYTVGTQFQGQCYGTIAFNNL